MSWSEDLRFEDLEHGITGWGTLPTPEQQADRDVAFIMDLQIQGFTCAEILSTRSVKKGVNWRYGDPEIHMEAHWQMFEAGYASEEDEITASETIRKINEYRKDFEDVLLAPPDDDMRFEAGHYETLPEGHGLIAVMVRTPKQNI